MSGGSPGASTLFPNGQDQQNHQPHWGVYPAAADLPNDAGNILISGKFENLRVGHLAYVTGLGTYQCDSVGTVGGGDAVWSALGGGVAATPIAAMFFALMPGDNAATIAPGAAVLFPQDGPSIGGGAPVRTGPSTFNVVTAGLYQISWQCDIDEAAQLMLRVNAVIDASTVASRAGLASQVSNTVLVQLGAGSIVEVINPPGNAAALTITPSDGNLTHAVGATLTFVRIG